MVGLLMGPLSAGAAVPTTTGICGRIESTTTDLSAKFSQLEKTRLEKRTEVLEKVRARKLEQNSKIAKHRTDMLAKWEEKLKEITADATTDEQKTALAEFRVLVKTAMDVRKTAVDAAMLDYRTDLEALVASRQEQLRSATTAFRTSVTAAIAKAKADCAAGVLPEIIRQTLIASIKTAREKLQTEMKALDPNGPTVRELVQTRNESVRKANQTFKETVQTGKEELKQAFKDEEEEAETP